MLLRNSQPFQSIFQLWGIPSVSPSSPPSTTLQGPEVTAAIVRLEHLHALILRDARRGQALLGEEDGRGAAVRHLARRAAAEMP